MKDEKVTLSVPISRYKNFNKKNPYMRLGQEFYNFMSFHKVVSEPNKAFCDKLYVADDAKANEMIQSIIDHHN